MVHNHNKCKTKKKKQFPSNSKKNTKEINNERGAKEILWPEQMCAISPCCI